ncbi:MAG: STAS domain-containing protein [Thermoleophilia bacterium]
MSPVVPHFELAEESSSEGAHVIRVRGEIHVSTAPEFAQRLSTAIDGGKTAIVLDMSGVEFIDSTGLSVLLNGLRLVTQTQGRMAIVCANPTVLRLFQITRLDDTFDIFDDRRQAIAHVLQEGGSSTEGSSAGAP